MTENPKSVITLILQTTTRIIGHIILGSVVNHGHSMNKEEEYERFIELYHIYSLHVGLPLGVWI